MSEGTQPAGGAAERRVEVIPLDRLAPWGDNPRQKFAEEGLHELAGSLAAQGQLHPLHVWREPGGDPERPVFRIIAGERRYRAAHIAGLAALECVVHVGEALTKEDRLELALADNLREDLSPLERARAFGPLLARCGCSIRELAQRLGPNHGTVSRALKLLEGGGAAGESPAIAGRVGPRAGRGKGAKVWKKPIPVGDGYSVNVEGPRQVTLQRIAKFLQQAKDVVESDGRGRARPAA
jgi:ParB/RepB/Spo0J family partition protein